MTSLFSFRQLRRDWLSNLRGDLLSGIVVAMALIPEAIGFSVIAGIDLRVGLYASVVIAIVISFARGRTGLYTFVAGAFLLFLLLVLGDVVGLIPMPALVAIVIMVSVGAFSWTSLNALRTHPKRSSVVMLAR